MIRLMNGKSSSYIKNNYAIQYVMIYVISMLSVNFEKTHIIKDGSKRERVDKRPENISRTINAYWNKVILSNEYNVILMVKSWIKVPA